MQQSRNVPEADIVVNEDDCLYIFAAKYKIQGNGKTRGRTKEK